MAGDVKRFEALSDDAMAVSNRIRYGNWTKLMKGLITIAWKLSLQRRWVDNQAVRAITS